MLLLLLLLKMMQLLLTTTISPLRWKRRLTERALWGLPVSAGWT
jgi:hypothetical protein